MANKKGMPGRRSPAEALKTREKILRQAERLFARKGYRGVSTREIASACRVHHYTVQHHFGSKMALYEAVLSRWDDEVRERATRKVAEEGGGIRSMGQVIAEIFDFLLEKHEWVALNVRNGLGEGLPGSVSRTDRSWVGFLDSSRRKGQVGPADVDTRLLLITVEGILHNHVLAGRRYKDLFGVGIEDPRLHRRVRRHIEDVLLLLTRGTTTRRPRTAGAKASKPVRRTVRRTERTKRGAVRRSARRASRGERAMGSDRCRS